MTKEDQDYLETMIFGALNRLESLPVARLVTFMIDKGVPEEYILSVLKGLKRKN